MTALSIAPTEGVSGYFHVATVSDGSEGASEFIADIDWGDGTAHTLTSGGCDPCVPTALSPWEVYASHTYEDEASHTITVSVVDLADTESNSDTSPSFGVAEHDSLAAGPRNTVNATERGFLSFVPSVALGTTLATFTDTYTGDRRADFSVTVHWDNGIACPDTTATTANFGLTFDGTSGGVSHYSVKASVLNNCVYAPEERLITGDTGTGPHVTVTDTGNIWKIPFDVKVVEGDTLVPVATVDQPTVAPTVSIPFSGDVAVFHDTTLTRFFLDPSFASSAKIFWGDGTNSAGVVSDSECIVFCSYWEVDGVHTYSHAGRYLVRVYLYDTGGGAMTHLIRFINVH
ncbi:MAG: hypothetical protein E6J14_13480 [Chloroflexi bacterium]|nr:MAG: hypothetical protein E6J14_13480 [Chloroflexota bacterium]